MSEIKISMLQDDRAAPAPTIPAAPIAFATECDLVLKGGITSGVVYPLAVVEISRAFRLRGIGGTSAGAIAAAAAAAAELGRQRHQANEVATDPKGFDVLEQLPEHLCEAAASGRGTKLLAFFKPDPVLRPVFDSFTAVFGAKGSKGKFKAVVQSVLSHYGLEAALGALVGGGPLFAATRSASPWLWLWAVLGALTGVLAFVAGRVAVQLLRGLPANGFGLCSGMAPPGDSAPEEALTAWLAQYLDALSAQRLACAGAGTDVERQQPMTFGDLRRHGIDLQMMTTCLTMGRPFRLPFRDEENARDNNQFFYEETKFATLFPENVVNWMVARERPIVAPSKAVTSAFAQMDFTGMRRMPLPDDLPVIMAVRMSLSFPILLSAIPLHAVDFRRDYEPGAKPERCWFTDGGVGSNFPIHFFDSALPTRPTFGLDLGKTDNAHAPRVRFPDDNGDARLTYWRRFAPDGIAGIAGFLGNVGHVAKDWNHETLSHLPGFRDRIGLILLTKEEGGLNLTMPPERIANLTRYGREAGQQIVARFGDPSRRPPGIVPSGMDWSNHQRIRLRLLLASLAEILEGLERTSIVLGGTPADYERFFAQGQAPHTYRFEGLSNLAANPATGHYSTQAGLAHEMLKELRTLARLISASVAMKPGVHPARGAPKPTPELKLRPRV